MTNPNLMPGIDPDEWAEVITQIEHDKRSRAERAADAEAAFVAATTNTDSDTQEQN